MVEQVKKFSNAEVIDREVSDQEMQRYFSDADWIVLPYSSATQSGVIIDAYKYSRPVIAFDVGAISEQIIDGATGYLIPEGDVAVFSEKVREASKMNDTDYREFTKNAYSFGKKQYSAESSADLFLSIVYAL